MDVGNLVVGLSAAAVTLVATLLTRKAKSEDVQVESQTSVLTGWANFTDDITARLAAVEKRLAHAEERAGQAERALDRAQIVISLLVAQIRSLGAEPDLPAHLSDIHESTPGGTP